MPPSMAHVEVRVFEQGSAVRRARTDQALQRISMLSRLSRCQEAMEVVSPPRQPLGRRSTAEHLRATAERLRATVPRLCLGVDSEFTTTVTASETDLRDSDAVGSVVYCARLEN